MIMYQDSPANIQVSDIIPSSTSYVIHVMEIFFICSADLEIPEHGHANVILLRSCSMQPQCCRLGLLPLLMSSNVNPGGIRWFGS